MTQAIVYKLIKYVIGIVFALSVTPLSAQNRHKSDRFVDEIYGETDPILEGRSLDVPDKFKDASAVFLAIIASEHFTASSKARVRTIYYRILLKINDRAARDRFSTFSFSKNTPEFFNDENEKQYVLKIIKPSGEKINLKIETFQRNADDEVALPNLEEGDVIDIGIRIIEPNKFLYCFTPKIETLNKDFPIVYGYLRYNVDHSYYVNFMGQNGAPQLVRNNPLSDANTRVYDLEYSNLEPISRELWALNARTQKTIKFQVCYYPSLNTTYAPMLLGVPYKIKASSDDREKMRAFRMAFNFSSGPAYQMKYFKKWYKYNFAEAADLTNEEYMNYAYYHFRYYSLIFNPKNKSYTENYQSKHTNRRTFVQLMRQVAEQRDIPFEPVFSTSKEISNFDDGLLISEFSYIIRYQTENGVWQYMENPTSYQTTEYFNHNLQGQDALALNQNDSIERIKIPISNFDDNLYKIQFTVNPMLDSKSAKIKAVSTSKGCFKYDLSRTVLKGVEFHDEAMKSMLPDSQSDVMLEKKKFIKGKKNTEDKVIQKPEDKLLEMKRLRSEDFDIDEYTSFEVLDSGVKSAKDSLIYRESYSIKEVIEKAGPSYIINLSKIALDQISFTDEEKAERRNDIYINYPKTYEYFYRINIPEGYRAFGLESLSASTDSKYGSVEMNAEEKDNQVLVYLKKVYKKSFVPKEEWPTMMEFLEPAMKINDARIVLKKDVN